MRPEAYGQRNWKYIGYGILFGLGFVFLYLVFLAGHFAGLADPSAMDYAQVARRVVHGQGFTTSFLRPYSLMQFPSVSEQPETASPPLHICLTAAMMKLVGTTSKAAALASGVPFLLTLPLVFFLGRRFFDIRTAALAMVLVGTSDVCLRLSISGIEVPLGGLLATALFLVMAGFASAEHLRRPLAVGAGALCALLYLTNYLWLAFLPPALVFVIAIAGRPSRWRFVGLALFGFVVVCSPWWLRNGIAFRNPFYTTASKRLIMDTRSHPGNTLLRRCEDEPMSYPLYVIHRPHEIVQKAGEAAQRMYTALPELVGLWVLPFLVAAALVVLGSREFEVMRLTLYLAFALVAVGLMLTGLASRLLMPFVPVFAVIAAGQFMRLLDGRTKGLSTRAQRTWQWTGVACLLALHWFPLTRSLAPGSGLVPEESAPARAATDIGSIIDGPVLTDAPWVVAWVSDRPAIWLPHTAADLTNLQSVIGPVKWLLLTPNIAASAETERTQDWAEQWQRAHILDTRIGDFALYRRLSGGDWILFRRGGTLQPTGTK
jgi:4-amino-4-deoxy-L-arabinose transferase-like glycosyltransferase